MSANPVPPGPNRPIWATWVLPIAGLLLLAAAITFLRIPASLQTDIPPAEVLSLERIVATSEGLTARVVNAGPQPVTIAQVAVDEQKKKK